MPEYIVNPRRAPRAPVRCEARVALRSGGFFAAPTTDVGPGGCQVTTPTPLAPGARVFLELAHSDTPVPFHFSGRVAWARSDPAPRAGIAFDDVGSAPADLYGRVADAAAARVPDALSVEAELAPASPPAVLPSLTSGEALVLAAVGAGLPVGELRSKLADWWEEAVVPVFALLGRGLLVMGPPDAAAARAWGQLLARR